MYFPKNLNEMTYMVYEEKLKTEGEQINEQVENNHFTSPSGFDSMSDIIQ